jgi:hypothetical protein
MTDLIAVDQVWRRKSDGRAPVRIGRVWHGAFTGVEDDYVRCHPVRGGTVWTTTLEEFLKRYERSLTEIEAHDARCGHGAGWAVREAVQMSDKSFWVVEMEGVESGEIDERRVFDSPENLGNYVRVNANDARTFRIAQTSEMELTDLRIEAAFGGDDG